MIGKISKGQSFSGVLRYLENKVSQGVGTRIGSNMYGKTENQLSNEFEIVSSQRPNLGKPVFHASLNLAPGEKLSDKQFMEMAHKYMNEMGFSENQFLVYRHFDREHDHIHIVANRVNMAGKTVTDKNDFRKTEAILRSFEQEYGLKKVENSQESKARQLSKGQIEYYRRTGEVPAKTQIAAIIDDSLQRRPSLPKFIDDLQKNGVNVVFHGNKQKAFGISYELEGSSFKGSNIGRGYTWSKIQKQLNYEHERELNPLRPTGSRGKKENIRGANQSTSGNKYLRNTGVEGTDYTGNKITAGATGSGQGRGTETGHNTHSMERSGQDIRRNPETTETSWTTNNIKNIFTGSPGGNSNQSGNMGSNSDNRVKKWRKRRNKKGPKL
jgi:hypothetical protein